MKATNVTKDKVGLIQELLANDRNAAVDVEKACK